MVLILFALASTFFPGGTTALDANGGVEIAEVDACAALLFDFIFGNAAVVLCLVEKRTNP